MDFSDSSVCMFINNGGLPGVLFDLLSWLWLLHRLMDKGAPQPFEKKPSTYSGGLPHMGRKAMSLPFLVLLKNPVFFVR